MTETFTYEKPDNLVDLWEGSCSRFASKPLFGTKTSRRTFAWTTYGEVGRRIDDLRAGFAQLGVSSGDAVGIIANNRVEWAVSAVAAYGRLARFVPMYEAELPATWEHIVRNSGVKVLLVSKPEIAERLKAWPSQIPGLKQLVVIDSSGEGSLAALEELGRKHPVAALRPKPSDPASVLYTSGTTGEAKGVVLSHGNITCTVRHGQELYPTLGEHSRCLNVLPWAHVYAQTGELFNFISLGAAIAISGGREAIAEELTVVRPDYFVAVPRLFNRIHAGIFAKMREAGGLKLKLFEAALAEAKKRRVTGKAGLRYRVLDRLVLAKIRERFGGRLVGSLSASARLDPEVAQFFFDVGVPVYDCYGLTETSPAIAMNHPGACKLGTVGKPVRNVRVVIDTSMLDDGSGDGEIVVYGPNVMLGYHGKPEATAAAMTPDGGFRTGDRGRLDAEGFLRITGRFKEQYKLDNGKYVFPASIEEELARIPYVTSSMVYGEGRPYNVAVVALDLAMLARHATDAGLTVTPGDLLEHPTRVGQAAQELIAADLGKKLEGKFGHYEIPKRFLWAAEPFSVENGLLTQTLKVRRPAVLGRYEARLQALYGQPGAKSG